MTRVRRRQPSVLVVDDDASILTMVTRALSSGGYSVRTATDGDAALECVVANPPELLLLDWMMPRVDGMTVFRAMRRDPALRDIPVIFMTARADPKSAIRGIQAGARAFVTKPFRIAELVARVGRTI